MRTHQAGDPAIVLYLPDCPGSPARWRGTGGLLAGALGAAAVLGRLPIAVCGYGILFLGVRLF